MMNMIFTYTDLARSAFAPFGIKGGRRMFSQAYKALAKAAGGFYE